MKEETFKKVVIVGREADVWLSALALQRRFSKYKGAVEIEVVELPPSINQSDSYITSPGYRSFHDFLGLDKDIIAKHSNAVSSFGQRFSNWCGPAPAYIHSYDRHGYDFNGVDFIHYWLRAKQSGLNVAYENFSFGAMAALNNRYVVFNEQTENFSNATYGYNYDALSYVASIARAALKLGVKHRRDFVEKVNIQDGQIQSLALYGGDVISADLFLDASGDEAVLIGKLESEENFINWSQWFPFDRKLVASSSALKPVPSYSQITAFKDGWFGLYPLQNRTALTAMISTTKTSFEDTLHNLASLTSMKLESVEAVEFVVGARQKSWIGNCCAIGSTCASLEQLDAVDLHMSQVSILYLCTLFPNSLDFERERTLFNRKVLEHAESARDFQALHYVVSDRRAEPLWAEARATTPPTSLARKLELFRSNGKLSMNDVELFQEESWYSVLLGQNVIPGKYDPAVNAMPESEQIEKFQKMLAYISSEVDALPTLQTELELRTGSDNSGSFF
jgi:tryptophan halogenase